MIYDGDPFCAQDLNEQGKWLYVDFSLNPIWYSTDPPIVVTCYGMRYVYEIQINREHGNILGDTKLLSFYFLITFLD